MSSKSRQRSRIFWNLSMNKHINSAWGWKSEEFLHKDFVLPVLLGSSGLPRSVESLVVRYSSICNHGSSCCQGRPFMAASPYFNALRKVDATNLCKFAMLHHGVQKLLDKEPTNKPQSFSHWVASAGGRTLQRRTCLMVVVSWISIL